MNNVSSTFIYHVLFTILFSVCIFESSCSSKLEVSGFNIQSGYTLDSNSELSDINQKQYINYGSEIFDSVIRLIVVDSTNSSSSCTGSVVSHNTVLTSAHCFNNNIVSVRGFQTNPDGSVKGEIFKAKAIYINPSFEFMLNDLAAVVFDDNTFSSFLEVYPGYLDTEENIQIFLQDLSKKTSTTDEDINKSGAIFIGYGSYQKDLFDTYNKKVGKALINFNDPLTLYSSTNKSIRFNDAAFNIFNLSEPGDSGGPLLYKGKLVAITMGTSPEYSLWTYINDNKNRVSKYFPQSIAPSGKIKTNYNWNFLTQDLENKAVISGMNAGIRTVELNGKIKVIQKYNVNTALDPQLKDTEETITPKYTIPNSNQIIYYSPSKILSDNSTLKPGDIIVGYLSTSGPVFYNHKYSNLGSDVGSFVKQVIDNSSYWERKKLPWIVIEDNSRFVVRSDIQLDIPKPKI